MARLWVTDVLRVCTCACRRACASVCARGERIQHVHPRRYEWMDRYAEWIDTRVDTCDIEFTNARMGVRTHTHAFRHAAFATVEARAPLTYVHRETNTGQRRTECVGFALIPLLKADAMLPMSMRTQCCGDRRTQGDGRRWHGSTLAEMNRTCSIIACAQRTAHAYLVNVFVHLNRLIQRPACVCVHWK